MIMTMKGHEYSNITTKQELTKIVCKAMSQNPINDMWYHVLTFHILVKSLTNQIRVQLKGDVVLAWVTFYSC